MISVVTVSRQLGSGGNLFAQKLAKRLNYTLVWREVINQAAIKIGAPEVALAMIDELGLLGLCPDPQICQQYIDNVNQIVLSYATKGNIIIVGRAGQIILKTVPNCLHLRIIADEETRIANVMQEKKVNYLAAKAQIYESDQNRKKYLDKFYHVEWNNPCLYDLTFNLSRFPVEKAVEWISMLVK